MKKFYLTLCLLFSISFCQSQGDTPCLATPLTQYGYNTPCISTSYSNVGFSDSGEPDPGCANYQGADVWFTAEVDNDGQIEIETNTNGGMTDGGMAVYTGTCAALNLYACDDDGNPALFSQMSNITINDPALSGQTIFIRVWEFGGDDNGSFDICANYCTAANDLCIDASPILSGSTVSGNNFCGNINADDPTPIQISAGTLENTVWYSFTVPTSGTYEIVFANSSCISGSSIQAGILTGACGGPYTSVGDNSGTDFTISFNATTATTYYLVVDGNAGSLCSYDFIINATCPISNDDCGTAFDLTSNTGSDSQECYNSICNNGADDDITFAGSCGDPSGAVLWYQITTDAGDGLLDIQVTSTDFSPHIQTFDNCVGTNTFNFCNTTSGNTATISQIPVSGSTTYYFTVSPNAGIGEGDFDLCVTSYPNPCSPSDDCSGVGPTTIGPLVSSVESCITNECNIGADVSFAPGATSCGIVQGD